MNIKRIITDLRSIRHCGAIPHHLTAADAEHTILLQSLCWEEEYLESLDPKRLN